jgi:hypothetical protein
MYRRQTGKEPQANTPYFNVEEAVETIRDPLTKALQKRVRGTTMPISLVESRAELPAAEMSANRRSLLIGRGFPEEGEMGMFDPGLISDRTRSRHPSQIRGKLSGGSCLSQM